MEKIGNISKEYMVSSIADRFKNYPDFFITTFSNIGVNDVEKLRKNLKKNSAHYMVIKNSILKHALESAGKDLSILNDVKDKLKGACGIVFSKKDPAIAARSLVDFNKKFTGMEIQGAFVNGEKINTETVKVLASLPPREVLLAMVASGMKSPISGFVGLLGNLLRNLVGVIQAISNKKSS